MILSHACKQDGQCVFVSVLAVHDDTLSVLFDGRPTIISRYLTFTVRRGDFVAPAYASLIGQGKAIRAGLRLSDVKARVLGDTDETPVTAPPHQATPIARPAVTGAVTTQTTQPAVTAAPPQASLFPAAPTQDASIVIPPSNRRRVFRASAPLPTLKER